MDKVVIEVPAGQTAKVNKQADGNVLVTFEKVEHWEFIKDIKSAYDYLISHDICPDIIKEYRAAPNRSYSEAVAAYCMVIAALTNNEERHLITGERWYPVIQFCEVGKERNCYGNQIVGTIESEGERFSVVGGSACNGSNEGLGYFSLRHGVSYSNASVGFRSVSSKEIAKHISKYFGRLLFTVHYGGINCNWKWVE